MKELKWGVRLENEVAQKLSALVNIFWTQNYKNYSVTA